MAEDWRKIIDSLDAQGNVPGRKKAKKPATEPRQQLGLADAFARAIRPSSLAALEFSQDRIREIPEIISGIGRGFAAQGRSTLRNLDPREIGGGPKEDEVIRKFRTGEITREDMKAQLVNISKENLAETTEGALTTLGFIPGVGFSRVGLGLAGIGGLQTGQAVAEKGVGRALKEDTLKIALATLGARSEVGAFRNRVGAGSKIQLSKSVNATKQAVPEPTPAGTRAKGAKIPVPESPSRPGGLSRAAEAGRLDSSTRAFVENLPENEGLSAPDAINRGVAIKPNGKPYTRKSGNSTSQLYLDEVKQYGRETKPTDRELLNPRLWALTADGRAVRPDGYGGANYREVIVPTREATLVRDNAIGADKGRVAQIHRKHRITDEKKASTILEKVGEEELNIPPEELITTPSFKGHTQNEIAWAQEIRGVLNGLHEDANIGRAKAGRPQIGFINKYMSHMRERNTIWDDFVAKKNEDVGAGAAPLPDFINPNQPVNPHAKPRLARGNKYNRNAFDVIDNYIDNMHKDTYNTPIIENGKIHAQALRDAGQPINARWLESWLSETYAGVPGAVDRAISLTPKNARVLDSVRGKLQGAIFSWNASWTTFIQTSSAALTFGRFGRHMIPGAIDWFGSQKYRSQLRSDSYTLQTKGRQRGSFVSQDMDKPIKVDRFTNFEKVDNVGTYLGRVVEHHLTGMSEAAGRRKGQARGLKGKDLDNFGADAGANTQSMYNLEDLPGILRNKSVKTGLPLQTFSMELFSMFREIKGTVGEITPLNQRMAMGLRLVGAMYAVNAVNEELIGRKPFTLQSGIPFVGPLIGAARGKAEKGFSNQNPIVLAGIAEEFYLGYNDLLRTGNTKRLKRALITWGSAAAGVKGGVQLNRVYDTVEAIANGGDVLNNQGEPKFNIQGEELRSLFSGPSRTQAGIEFSRSNKRPSAIEAFQKRTGGGGQEQPKSSFKFRGR